MDSELEVATRKLVFALAEDIPPKEDDRTDIDAVNETISELQRAIADLGATQDEVEQLRSRVDSLETLVHAQGKRGKVAAIIKYAKHKGSQQDDGVMLSPKEIRGATGVSRRYSYQIIEDWPDEFGFFLRRENLSQYGQLEIATDADGPRLVVVFDGSVHSRVTSVNQFNTEIAVEGGDA
jgi:hypothetical protein